MAEKFEYYDAGEDANFEIYYIYWGAQSFTPSQKHEITSVKLLVYREGLPGTQTIHIRSSLWGNDLCSGTLDGDSITDNTAGEWVTVTLSSTATLEANTTYYICVEQAASANDPSHTLHWLFDTSSATYAGGKRWRSSNDGAEGSWTSYSDDDFLFEEWGNPYTSEGLSSQLTIRRGTSKDLSSEFLSRQTDEQNLYNKLLLRQASFSSLNNQLTYRIPMGLNLDGSLFIRGRSTLRQKLISRSYISEGTLTSVQLLPSYSKAIFAFESNVTLNGGTVKVQFSDDNVNFYNHVGALNAWDTLGEGYNFIYVSKANLTDKFYYKLKLTKGVDNKTPYVDWIKVTYLIPHSAYSTLSSSLSIKGLDEKDLFETLKIRKSTYNSLDGTLLMRHSGYNTLLSKFLLKQSNYITLLQQLGINFVWDTLPGILKFRKTTYSDFSGILLLRGVDSSDLLHTLAIIGHGYSDLNQTILFRKLTHTDFPASLLLRKSMYKVISHTLVSRPYGYDDLLLRLLIRRHSYKTFPSVLFVRGVDSSDLDETLYIPPRADLYNELLLRRAWRHYLPGTLVIPRFWWREINGKLTIPLYSTRKDLPSSLLLRKKQVSSRPRGTLLLRRPNASTIIQELLLRKDTYQGLGGSIILSKSTLSDLSGEVTIKHRSFLGGELTIRSSASDDIVESLIIRVIGENNLNGEIRLQRSIYSTLLGTLELYGHSYSTLSNNLHIGRLASVLESLLLMRKSLYKSLSSSLELRRVHEKDLSGELLLRNRYYSKLYNSLLLRNKTYRNLPCEISIWRVSLLNGTLYVEYRLRTIEVDVEKASVHVQLLKGRKT